MARAMKCSQYLKLRLGDAAYQPIGWVSVCGSTSRAAGQFGNVITLGKWPVLRRYRTFTLYNIAIRSCKTRREFPTYDRTWASLRTLKKFVDMKATRR